MNTCICQHGPENLLLTFISQNQSNKAVADTKGSEGFNKFIEIKNVDFLANYCHLSWALLMNNVGRFTSLAK